MPIYVKNLLLWNQKADDLETWYADWLLEYYQVGSNDDPGLISTIDFSETIVIYDIKVGRSSQLNEYMNL